MIPLPDPGNTEQNIMLRTLKIEEARLFTGIAAASGTSAQLSQIALPLLVSSLIVGLNLSEQNAGLLCSIELVTVALASFALAPRISAWSPRHVAIIGACIAITGHVLSGMVDEFQSLVFLRVLAGAGAGAMLATGNACVASSRNPDRLFSLVLVVTGLAHLVVLNLMPPFVTKWSYSGAFAFEAVFIALLMPLMLLLPRRGHASTRQESTPDKFPLLPAIAIVLIIGLFFTRETALWAFSQEIGLRTGLSYQQVGSILGIAGLAAILGAGIAAIVGTRFGRLTPMLLGLVINTVIPFIISQTSNSLVFTVCQISYHLGLFFTVPYLFGMAAKLDPKGRLMAVGGGALVLGGATGPGAAGLLISWGGYYALGGFIIVSMTLVTIMAVLMNAHIERANRIGESTDI